ncbi:OLC1v1028804C1 [Oldenlandia corymbosa var. corymbosa]|uniref:OLC1v1028804C1 n=1 Tax=Oldenlandia corymbosa var. corymbosa TaxID=529605 RepID=A0AAV1CCK4_OLDCO|nr:OLC1v1028804C1 [Oldenlandia corymbosa var. corymbosa]
MAFTSTAAASSSSSSSSTRQWRTAFLTLRDEIQTSDGVGVNNNDHLRLLNHVIFSQSDSILSAASELPPREVESDVVLIMELALNVSDSTHIDDLTQIFIHLSKFIHSTVPRVAFVMNQSSLAMTLDCFRRALEVFVGSAKSSGEFTRNASVIGAIKQCLESARLLFEVPQKTSLLPDHKRLLDFLHLVIAGFQMAPHSSSSNTKVLQTQCTWEVQKTAFALIGEVYSKVEQSMQVDVWKSTIEVLRQVIDLLASKGPLKEDSFMARFYCSVLHCLHLVLMNPKGSLSAHVSGFIAVLRMFLNYGVAGRNPSRSQEVGIVKEHGSSTKNVNVADLNKSDSSRYRPPHLRKELKSVQKKDEEVMAPTGLGSSTAYQTFSDSDYSDSEGSVRDPNIVLFGKTRLAAIVCIQDLCRDDPEVFTSQWTVLLPRSDILQPRKYEATLMSCLLFDPYLKARLASAAAITGMLDGPAAVFLKVAEYKDSNKIGSFTALSISLGQISMQLHSGILYLIKYEPHKGVLAAIFKLLTALISSTPYSRMPMELLPSIISSLQVKIEDTLSVQSDQTSVLAGAIDCLTVALSVSPPSDHVKDMLLEEVARGFSELQKRSGILSLLFRCSEPLTCPSICLESLQALRIVAHNYPGTMSSCWKQVSSIVFGLLSCTGDMPARSWKNNTGYTGGPTWEKVITAAIKVLDGSLRAISGFKGTEDLSDDKLLDSAFTPDSIRMKTISSAPLDGLLTPTARRNTEGACLLGNEQWSEAIVRHMPLCLRHSSGMVRAASVTCFAGLTSPVLVSLTRAEQDFILSSSVHAALGDEVPSVRSAACRAIGVIACFPPVIHSGEILNKLINAAVHNSNDLLVSVRITASWALANICDSLRHCVEVHTSDSGSIDSKVSQELILLLIDSALRLSKDNDKVKANAVRALGNLSRFVPFSGPAGGCDETVNSSSSPLNNANIKSSSKPQDISGNSKSLHSATPKVLDWLGKTVQAFVSCITTGNVKVQWNVCHALSNLFLNKTLELHDKDWAPTVFSVLLLLLRDSANFKIRIQAAAALAVPSKVNDYGSSFSDVLQGVVHVLENLGSDQVSKPADLKYRVALEMQLTSTTLHVISLAPDTEWQGMDEFLVKKKHFLEEWLGALCLSLKTELEDEHSKLVDVKRGMIDRALQSLIKVFEVGRHDASAIRFQKLLYEIA